MKCVEGYIYDINLQTFIEGRLHFDSHIQKIEVCTVSTKQFILPGFVDAHVHIESSMLSPLNYSREAVKHGVVASVTDPHEIANVCGRDGLEFMIESAAKSPMKIAFGVPSCVPATEFETSGESIDSTDVEQLFENPKFTHLSEMMNFPGVLFNDTEVWKKIEIAKKLGKPIDGHAPLLTGEDLKGYVEAGISTDHECTSVAEALEKIKYGMKIMLRNSSASKDFDVLHSLIETNPDDVMLCTDDCHPDELERGYIDNLVRFAITQGYSIPNSVKAATLNAVRHYKLPVGLLQLGDASDFIVLNNLNDFQISSTYIDGIEVWNGYNVAIPFQPEIPVNRFFQNEVNEELLHVKRIGKRMRVIEIIPDSLLTNEKWVELDQTVEVVESDPSTDILKMVVLNRYSPSKPAVAFIQGFQIKQGAIASTIAHDSHNIVAVGVDDASLVKAIQCIQKQSGGLCVVNGDSEYLLPLPVAGLMSLQSAHETADGYTKLVGETRTMGCSLKSPFMTLGFMSLLVIPHLKLSDKGLFDGNSFQFVSIQE
jgi:adenine deaminase